MKLMIGAQRPLGSFRDLYGMLSELASRGQLKKTNLVSAGHTPERDGLSLTDTSSIKRPTALTRLRLELDLGQTGEERTEEEETEEAIRSVKRWLKTAKG